MMISSLDPPLVPRDGRTLRVVAVCRISTEHQDQKSLNDQEALLRRYVSEHYDGPVKWSINAETESGEYLDRAGLADLNEAIQSGMVDLVVCEDLGRVCRRVDAITICEKAEDHDTRIIAINDHVDTAREDWHPNALLSVFRHEAYNRDTGKRIRRTLRNRFMQGGVVQSVIYGYVKPPGTKMDTDLYKDKEAEPIFDKWFTMLEDGASYSEVADWLNQQRIRPGPACRTDSWDHALVRNVTYNPILKGVRVRNRKMSKRVNKTGRPRSVDAPPQELLERPASHLAFIDSERYDRVISLLTRRNSKYRRKGKGGTDTRKNVPKKRTIFPGQHLTCGVCGRTYYFGGHGRKTHMMCSGSRLYRCWNGVTLDSGLATSKIGEAVLAKLGQLPEFDDYFTTLVREEAESLQSADVQQIAECVRRENAVKDQITRTTDAIASLPHSPALLEKLKSLEAELAEVVASRTTLQRLPRTQVEIPPIAELRAQAAQAFERLAGGSPEASRLARRLIPRLEVHPYRLCDGGTPVLRAHLTLDLASLVPDARALEGRTAVMRHELVVDLFDMPQRAAYRERVVALRGEGKREHEIAALLGLTKTAVQGAAALDRLMKERGLDDPYVLLTEPPPDHDRMRRHKHVRYRFEPVTHESVQPSSDAAAV
jgi:DNA invertase Pin-like site-specific DNA recombinase